jgi:hypothetical protein
LAASHPFERLAMCSAANGSGDAVAGTEPILSPAFTPIPILPSEPESSDYSEKRRLTIYRKLGMRPFGDEKFSNRVSGALSKAGWTVDRDRSDMEQVYAQILGDAWVPAAAPFVRSFGGLDIDHDLIARPVAKLAEIAEPALVRRVESVVGAKACPVAGANYMGDDCMIWIDENSRIYALDSEGLVFIGSEIAEVLEVLLFGAPPSPPPPELKDALARAYEWNK